jgi:hypothetical protein
MADAKLITATMLELIHDAANLNGTYNFAFRRAFVTAIPVTAIPVTAIPVSDPVSERHGLTSSESEYSLSSEGVSRATNAILVRAYGDPDLMADITESTDEEVKSMRNGLLTAAPRWAKFRAAVEAGDIRQDIDLTPELIEAIKHTADLRARGEKLGDYLAKHDYAHFHQIKDPVGAWMHMFYDPYKLRTAGADQIAYQLQTYAEQARIIANDARFQTSQHRLEYIHAQVISYLKG